MRHWEHWELHWVAMAYPERLGSVEGVCLVVELEVWRGPATDSLHKGASESSGADDKTGDIKTDNPT